MSAIGKKAAARLMPVINAGHLPGAELDDLPYKNRRGRSWVGYCSCGWRGNPRPIQKGAIAAALWHLERVREGLEEEATSGVSEPDS